MLLLAVPIHEGATPEEISAAILNATKRMDDMISKTLDGASEIDQRVVRTLLMWGQVEETKSFDRKLSIMDRCLVNLLDVVEKQLGGGKEEFWRECQRKCHAALDQLQAQIEKENASANSASVH